MFTENVKIGIQQKCLRTIWNGTENEISVENLFLYGVRCTFISNFTLYKTFTVWSGKNQFAQKSLRIYYIFAEAVGIDAKRGQQIGTKRATEFVSK